MKIRKILLLFLSFLLISSSVFQTSAQTTEASDYTDTLTIIAAGNF